MSIREMIRRAALEAGGLGVSTATRPDASPAEGTGPYIMCPPTRQSKNRLVLKSGVWG